MEEKGKVRYGTVIMFSGAMLAYLIGSGFSTGQEAMQFFTAFGLWKSLGAFVVSAIVFIWMGWVLVEDGRRLRLKQPSDMFSYYCGKFLGKFFAYFTGVFIYLIYVVMVAGSGAIMYEYYGLSATFGRVFMALLSLGTVLLGLRKTVEIIGRIGPVVIVICLAVGLTNIVTNFDQLMQADAIMASNADINIPKAASHWVFSGVLFAAFVGMVMVPFYVELGTQTISRREARMTGVLGSFLYVLGAAVVGLGMLASIQDVHGLQVPAVGVASIVSETIGLRGGFTLASIYSVLVVVEIYTSVVPMLWVPAKTVNPDEKSMGFRVTAIVGMCVALFFGSLLPFNQLVNLVFPISEYFGLMLMVCMLAKRLKTLLSGDDMSAISSAERLPEGVVEG